jgi:hypothetical protein
MVVKIFHSQNIQRLQKTLSPKCSLRHPRLQFLCAIKTHTAEEMFLGTEHTCFGETGDVFFQERPDNIQISFFYYYWWGGAESLGI